MHTAIKNITHLLIECLSWSKYIIFSKKLTCIQYIEYNINYVGLHLFVERECLLFSYFSGQQNRWDKFECNTVKRRTAYKELILDEAYLLGSICSNFSCFSCLNLHHPSSANQINVHCSHWFDWLIWLIFVCSSM